MKVCGEVDGAVRYGPIYLHSKTMVVDDEWATVGSANINERSIFSDPEANVAVEDHAFARDLRCKLMAEHLGVAPDDPRLADPQEAAAFWHERVEENAAARRAHKLAPGHAHPFEQEPSWSLLRGRATWF